MIPQNSEHDSNYVSSKSASLIPVREQHRGLSKLEEECFHLTVVTTNDEIFSTLDMIPLKILREQILITLAHIPEV